MKLTQFAFAAILILLGVAGYLTIKSDFDGRLDDQKAQVDSLAAKVEDLGKKQAAPAPVPTPVAAVAPPEAAPAPAAAARTRNPAAMEALAAAAAIPPDAPLAPEDDPRMKEDERDLLNAAAPPVPDSPEALPAAPVVPPANPSLNPQQRRIATLPAIARVKQYAEAEGIVGLDKGSAVGLKPGASFSLRRQSAVIAQIRISETITPDECAADVVSLVPGMVPAVGDEVVQYDQ